MSTACDGCGLEKNRYRSYGAAAAAASWMQAKQEYPLRVYYSSRCSCYHLSSRIDLTDEAC